MASLGEGDDHMLSIVWTIHLLIPRQDINEELVKLSS
jgi:hypothetical protein